MAPAMETLLETDLAADAVAQLLGMVRVRSSVYCRSVMRAPWGFGVLARPVAGFHLVTQGSCRLEVDGEAGVVPLTAGDLVILPRGSAHQVRSDPTATVRLLDDILTEHPVPDGRRSTAAPASPPPFSAADSFSKTSASTRSSIVSPPSSRWRARPGDPCRG